MAHELVTIGEKQVERLEYMGQPVMTMRQVDEIHDRKKCTASYNFHYNKKQFEEGADYSLGNSHTAKSLGIKAPSVTLLTESAI